MYELIGFNEERKRQESRRGRVWGIKELTGEVEKKWREVSIPYFV